MHVTFVGAGALGRIYGTRLASIGADTAFVVRPRRLRETTSFVIEERSGGKRRDTLAAPTRVADVPTNTDVVVVTVRFDQLLGDARDPILPKLLAGPRVPIVILTPMMPSEHARFEEALGRPIVSAMPGVAGYLADHDVVHYWHSTLVPTFIEERIEDPKESAAVDRFAHRLAASDLAVARATGVAALNAATTITFFPLIAAIGAAGDVQRALADAELLSLALAAARETARLARRVGKPAPLATMALRLANPSRLRAVMTAGRAITPELVHFLGEHFGPKLHDQHVAMGASIVALGAERGCALPALEELLQRVQVAAPRKE
jgi:2-dehydropantoate 2-reductase